MRWPAVVVLLLFVVIMLLIGVAAWSLFARTDSRPMNTTDVPGTYQQTFPWGTEVLTLDPGGTFREEFQYEPGYASGELIRNSGEWEMWTTADQEVMVRLKDAFVWPDFRGPQYAGGKATFTFKARESPRSKVLEKTPDPDGAVRLVRQ